MTKQFANIAAGLTLMLTASVTTPAWSAGNSNAAKCPYAEAKAREAKRAKVQPKAQPARGTMLVEKRKLDVQILSFGP